MTDRALARRLSRWRVVGLRHVGTVDFFHQGAICNRCLIDLDPLWVLHESGPTGFGSFCALVSDKINEGVGLLNWAPIGDVLYAVLFEQGYGVVAKPAV